MARLLPAETNSRHIHGERCYATFADADAFQGFFGALGIRACQQHRELIPSDSGHHVFGTEGGAEYSCHSLQELISLGMSECRRCIRDLAICFITPSSVVSIKYPFPRLLSLATCFHGQRLCIHNHLDRSPFVRLQNRRA